MGKYHSFGKQIVHVEDEGQQVPIETHIADAADNEKAHFLAAAANAYREPDMPLFDTHPDQTSPMTVGREQFEDDGTVDRLKTLHESGRAAVKAAMGESLLREPTKAPQGTGVPPYGFKPKGFA